VHRFIKAKRAKNWYRDVSGGVLRTLKEFCVAKSAKNLGVNIAISKCEFIGVAAFERT